MYSIKSVSAVLACAVTFASAHGHVDWLITNGIAYRGYDAPAFSWNPNIDPVVGWTNGATDNGYVEPKNFGDSDIICHRSGKAARGHVTVQAGDKITLQWNTWPESHKGPVIDYLAKCPGNCEDVDKTQLEFFKISASGLIDMSLHSGKWAADVLVANAFSWTVQIPANLAPGNYVLRHEIIALHGSGQPNGAQNYPQCFNLKVTGGGSLSPAGIKGTALYRSDDPGILFNLYTTPLSYTIPGPSLIPGVPSTVVQGAARATVTSSATTPGQSATGAASTQLSTSPPSLQSTSGDSASLTMTTLRTTTASAKPLDSTTEGMVCGPRLRLVEKLQVLQSVDTYAPNRVLVEPLRKFLSTNLPNLDLNTEKGSDFEDFAFTHLDIFPRNIIVSGEPPQITGIVDFKFSGFFPAAAEFLNDEVNNKDDWLSGFYSQYLVQLESKGVATPARGFDAGAWNRNLWMEKLISNIAPWWLPGEHKGQDLDAQLEEARNCVWDMLNELS